MKYIYKKLGLIVSALSLIAPIITKAADISLLNVSYDPTREFYQDYNDAFAKYWKAKTGDNVKVQASHGGKALPHR